MTPMSADGETQFRIRSAPICAICGNTVRPLGAAAGDSLAEKEGVPDPRPKFGDGPFKRHLQPKALVYSVKQFSGC
jgi:hypothetical protein